MIDISFSATTYTIQSTSFVNSFTVASTSSQVSIYTDSVAVKTDSIADVYKNNWSTGSSYYRGDLVNYDYDLYVSKWSNPITSFTSTVVPPNDLTNWAKIVWHEAPFDIFTATTATITDLTLAGLQFPKNKGLFGQVLFTNGSTDAQWVNLGDLNFWSLNTDLLTNGFDIVTGSAATNPELYIGSGSSGSFKSYLRIKAVPNATAIGDIEVKGLTTFLNPTTFDSQVTGQNATFAIFTATSTSRFNGEAQFQSGIRFADNTVQTTAFTGQTYNLPIATTSTLGGIKVGSGLSINPSTGVLTAVATSTYTLPIATESILGGIKIGSGLTVNTATGEVSVTGTGTMIIPTASTSTIGGVRVGSGLSIDGDGILSSAQYTLPIASASTLGGIRVGAGLEINAITGVLDFIGTTTVATGAVDLTQDMNTNGFRIRHSSGSASSYLDVNTNNVEIASSTITAQGTNVTNSATTLLTLTADSTSTQRAIKIGSVSGQSMIEIADPDRIELRAPNIVFTATNLTLGEQTTGTVSIGTLNVNRIYNYAGTFAPFFPAGVQFQDNTVQITAYVADGGLIP